MRRWLRQRPWIWLVLFFVVFILMDAVFVAIAVWNRPVRVG